MITALNILILTGLSFLTVSLFPHFRILGVVPLLPLFFIIQFAYFRKGFEPILLAAVSGIFLDLFSPYPFGFYLLLFLLTATIVRYFFDEGLRRLSYGHYILTASVAILIYYLAQFGMLWFEGVRPTVMAIRPVVSGILINAVFASILYLFGVWYFEEVIKIEDILKRR
jgi:rod shape-determining protein MreD